MSYDARTSSGSRAITRAGGPAPIDRQTATMKPREWNVSEPHSAGDIEAERATGERPSGPRRRYASVIHVSLWMLLRGSRARNGFCGVTVARSGRAVAAAP